MLKYGVSVVILWFSWSLNCHAQALHIRVMDVEEGQAILLHQNQRAVLIDTGHAGKAALVLRRMEALAIKSLDYLFITHLHPDHASGYFRVLEDYPQLKLRDSCYPVDNSMTPDMIRWVDQALQTNVQRKCVKSGEQIKWGASEIKILWPLRKPAKTEDLNHTSLVLQIEHHGNRLLVMGDAGLQAETKLLQAGLLQPVDILVVGHHGAEDATSEAFIQAVKPLKSVISTNKNNHRGYPSPGVIQRLKRSGSKVFTTFESGELHFEFRD